MYHSESWEHRIDFRVTVQRDAKGQWVVTATTLRRSGEGAVVTNHHSGGLARSIHSADAAAWIQSAHITEQDRQQVQSTALHAARALNYVYPNLAFLGVDVAPTKKGCYVYDCNNRPGRDILTDQQIKRFIDQLMGFISGNHCPSGPSRFR